MNYVPRMNNQIDGFSVQSSFRRRYWDGMVADLWEVNCDREAGGLYVARDPRLFILLNAHGSDESAIDIAEVGGGRLTGHGLNRAVSFFPADVEMQAHMRGLRRMRHLDLHFDKTVLEQRLGDAFDATVLDNPRLMLSEPRLIALAELIAAECTTANPMSDLYGGGLSLSLMLAVMAVPAEKLRARSKLAQWQIRRVTDFIQDNCFRNIRLEELARIAGLSECYFSHAFKATTGVPPHQWQMRARITRVKDMLLTSDMTLTEIAAETGFADPAHFTRAFRQQTGVSPSLWRRTERN